MEYHIFFRTTSAAKAKQGAKSNFARTGSRFRFSGRTECQAAAMTNLTRRSVNFERKASQRFSRRASYAIRKKIQEQEILREQEDERLRKLKFEQESKKSPEKRSSSQKTLNLSPTQRLENLIQQTSTTDDVNVPRPPPIPPRQTKSDEKTTTPPLSTLVLVKQSNSSSIVASTPSNDDQTENFIVESSSNANDQPLLIEMSPEKPIVTSTNKVNSPPHRYTLANSQSPFVLKETFFFTESTTVNSNAQNCSNSTGSTPVIVTRTLSTSNVRNATSTIVQTTTTANGSLTPCTNSSTNPFPNVFPRSSHRNSSSPSVTALPMFHPITTEL